MTVSATDVETVIAPMSDFMIGVKGNDLAPRIIEKWELSPDGTAWIFHIRKGIKWHNGEELTAKDLKFSLEQYAAPTAFTNFLRTYLNGVVDIVDDYTVRAFTKGPQPYVPWVISIGAGNQGFIAPKDYYEKNGKDYYEQHPIGNGPFKVVRRVASDLIEYEAVANHWRIVPDFKKVTLILIPEQTTRMAMLKTGAVDLIDVGVEDAIEAEKAGFRSAQLSVGADCLELFGTYGPEKDKIPTGDIRVRQALSLAINRDEIRQSLMYGKAGPPGPAFYTYDAADVDVDYWKSYLAKAYRYDPTEAKRLLKEAGYADGFPIKIWSFTQAGSPHLPKVAQVIQAYWRAVGVKAEIYPVDFSVFTATRAGGPNREPKPEIVGQASLSTFSQSPIAATKMEAGFRSKGTWGLLSTAKPEVDALLTQVGSELNDAKRREALAKVTQLIVDSYAGFEIMTTPVMAAFGPRIDVAFPSGTLAIPMYLDLVKHKK